MEPSVRSFTKSFAFCLFLIGCMSFALVGCVKNAPFVPKYPVKPASDSNNEFGLALFQQLNHTPKNVFFSPYSLSVALSMTAAGARGETAEAMKKVLRQVAKDKDYNASIHSMREYLRHNKGSAIRLDVANRLWAQKGYTIETSFQSKMTKFYNAPLRLLDFAKQAESARHTINAWVESQTQNKIKELLKPNILQNATKLVLTNAIYFKGNWENKFDKSNTSTKPFTMENGEKQNVPMMFANRKFRTADIDGHRLVSLPYKGKAFDMLLFLPKKGVKLADASKLLHAKQLAAWEQKMYKTKVQLSLPRFKMTSAFSMGKVLSDMGMSIAFKAGQADFGGINKKDAKQLYISAVVHKAFLEVNEEGSEAAAATAVVMTKSAASLPTVVTFDRPFLLMIRHVRSNTILFMGQLHKPQP